MRQLVFQRRVQWIVGIALTLTLAAGAMGTTKSSAAGKPIKLKWWYIPGTTQELIPQLLVQTGIAQKYGFTIETVKAAAPTQYLTLRAGDADLAAADLLTTLAQQKGGLRVKVVGNFLKYSNPVVASPTGPKSISGLKGKRLGTFSDQQIDFTILRAAAKKLYGFDPSKDAKVAQTSPALENEFLLKGKLDAALEFGDLAFKPVATHQLTTIATIDELIRKSGWNPNALDLIWIMRQGWIDQHKAAVPNLIKMIQAGQQALYHSKTAWSGYAKTLGVPPNLVNQLAKFERSTLATKYDSSLIQPTQTLFDGLARLLGSDVLGGVTKIDPSIFAFGKGAH